MEQAVEIDKRNRRRIEKEERERGERERTRAKKVPFSSDHWMFQ